MFYRKKFLSTTNSVIFCVINNYFIVKLFNVYYTLNERLYRMIIGYQTLFEITVFNLITEKSNLFKYNKSWIYTTKVSYVQKIIPNKC